MAERKTTRRPGLGTVDGGAGRGVPLGGRDERPPTGYIALEDDDDNLVQDLRDEFEEDDAGPERRRDPLRR